MNDWKCYMCGSTSIVKYNSVQDDGRYICENEHLLHEDALVCISTLEGDKQNLQFDIYRLTHRTEAAEAEAAALKGLRCDECDSREGQSHYCLLWSINTPDAHYCADWTARGETEVWQAAFESGLWHALAMTSAEGAEAAEAEVARLWEVERFAIMAVYGDVDESAKGWMRLKNVLDARKEAGDARME